MPGDGQGAASTFASFGVGPDTIRFCNIGVCITSVCTTSVCTVIRNGVCVIHGSIRRTSSACIVIAASSTSSTSTKHDSRLDHVHRRRHHGGKGACRAGADCGDGGSFEDHLIPFISLSTFSFSSASYPFSA